MTGVEKLVVFIAIAGLVFGDAFAQNRGSSRYVPPNEYADDNTPSQRLPRTRSSQTSRQTSRQPKQTQPPEPLDVTEDIQEYQPPELPSRSRTTGRRVPLRSVPQDFPDPTLLSADDRHPILTTEAEERPVPTTSAPSGRPPVRRRRPKKRKRPQPTGENEPVLNSGTSEAPISDLLSTDEKRPLSAHTDTSSRDSPSQRRAHPTFNPHLRSQADEELLGANKGPQTPARINEAEPQYFRPGAPRSRLSNEDNEAGQVVRNLPYQSIPGTRYISTAPSNVAQHSRDTYVPVLSPIRTPTREIARPYDYSEGPAENDRSEFSPNNPNYHSTQNTRSPNRYNPNIDESAYPAPKPSANIIPEIDEKIHPGRIHPHDEHQKETHPEFTDEYNPSGAQPRNRPSSRQIPTEDAYNDDEQELPKTTNRLPNSSEVRYESVYPSEDVERVTRAHISTEPPSNYRHRQTTSVKPHRNAVPSYSNVRNLDSTKPHEYDNDAETNAGQPPRYQPPLQRGSSRYSPGSPVDSSRSRSTPQPQETPSDVPRRTRVSTRQQATPEVPVRTRGSSRQQTTPEAPVRTRGTSRYQADTLPKAEPTIPPRSQQTPDRSRGVNTYQRDPVESGSRLSSRRQHVNPEDYGGAEDQQPNFEYSRVTQSEPKPARQPIHPSRHQASSDYQEDLGGYNTLRSRPQFVPKAVEEDETIREERTDFIPPQEAPPSNIRGTRYRPEQQSARQPERVPVREQSVQRQPAQRGQRNDGYPQYQAPQNPRHAKPEIRDYPQYEEPQNLRPLRREPETIDYPQYQEPQNPRRPSPPQSSRGSSRPLHQEPEPQTRPRGRSSGGSGFTCPDTYGFFADPVQCDKYYECRNGTAEVSLCSDGLAFNEVSAPKYLRCDSLRDVDCSSRPQLQEAQPSPNCPRKFGLFPDESDCTKFFNCVDGVATEVQCPPGLIYNDDRATCDWADLVKSSCKTEDLLGFTCPEPTDYDLQDGVYTRYAHPDNCQLHFTCIKGEDGLRRPRMLSCNEGLVFNPATGSCSRPDDVPGCEEFYGPRSPPKRKPGRQPAPREPEPEPEEYEEPTPRPRRRGQNRRTRN